MPALTKTPGGIEEVCHSSIEKGSYPQFTNAGFDPAEEGGIKAKMAHNLK